MHAHAFEPNAQPYFINTWRLERYVLLVPLIKCIMGSPYFTRTSLFFTFANPLIPKRSALTHMFSLSLSL